MRPSFIAVSLVLAAALSGAALAHEQPRFTPVQAHDPLECYCRAKGRIFAPGEQICLRTAEGPRLAECRMVTNLMSWDMTERPCPES